VLTQQVSALDTSQINGARSDFVGSLTSNLTL